MDKRAIQTGLSSLKSRVWDPRLAWALGCVMLFIGIDFFARFVSVGQPVSDREIIPVVSSVKIVPRLHDRVLASYLDKLNTVEPEIVVLEVKEAEVPVSVVDRKDVFGDEYWASGAFSYRLTAIAKRAERFAVLDRVLNLNGDRDVIEVRVGEGIDEFVVTDISVKGVTLRSDRKEIVRLVLFARAEQAAEVQRES